MYAVIGAALAVAPLAGCGSDDDASAQDQYCEAGESLEASVSALGDLDLVAEGTSGLETALDAIDQDVNTLQDTASDASEDEVSAVKESVDDLESALSDLTGEITSDNVSALSTAVQSVAESAQALYGTLPDCP
jgi:prophage DNA circulation protein